MLSREDIRIEVISFPDSWRITDTDRSKYYFDQVTQLGV